MADYLDNRRIENSKKLIDKIKIGYFINFNNEYDDVWHQVIRIYKSDNPLHHSVRFYDRIESGKPEHKEDSTFVYNIRKISADLPKNASFVACEHGIFSDRIGNLSQCPLFENVLNLTKFQEKRILESIINQEDSYSWDKNDISDITKIEPYSNNADWGSGWVWPMGHNDKFVGKFLLLWEDELIFLERNLSEDGDSYIDKEHYKIHNYQQLNNFIKTKAYAR